MIPIHILGGLKSIPQPSRTSVYTFIMEVNPPMTRPLLNKAFDGSEGMTVVASLPTNPSLDVTANISIGNAFSVMRRYIK